MGFGIWGFSGYDEGHTSHIYIYVIGLILAFVNLYQNLKVVSAFRKFSHALWKIMVDINAF
jgi:hypothetical protein